MLLGSKPPLENHSKNAFLNSHHSAQNVKLHGMKFIIFKPKTYLNSINF